MKVNYSAFNLPLNCFHSDKASYNLASDSNTQRKSVSPQEDLHWLKINGKFPS